LGITEEIVAFIGISLTLLIPAMEAHLDPASYESIFCPQAPDWHFVARRFHLEAFA